MNTLTLKAYFNITGLEKSMFRLIPGLHEAMQHELIRVYNIYANKANSGITDKLNEEYDKIYKHTLPNSVTGIEIYDMSQYNKFMADGYQRLIVNEINESNESPLLEFYIDPEEVNLVGMLKVDKNVKIDFYLKEV